MIGYKLDSNTNNQYSRSLQTYSLSQGMLSRSYCFQQFMGLNKERNFQCYQGGQISQLYSYGLIPYDGASIDA